MTPPRRFDGAALLQCYQLEPSNKKPLKVPSIGRCQHDAECILAYSELVKEEDKIRYENALKAFDLSLKNVAVLRLTCERLLSLTRPVADPARENPFLAELEELDGAEKFVRALRARYETALSRVLGWPDLAELIAGQVKEGLYQVSKPPKSVANPEAPLCIIVSNILKKLGYVKSPSTVSAVLQGRRGRRSKGVMRDLRTN